MNYELRMPDLSTNDAPVRIVRWIAGPGDTVRRGQPLLEVETDKATVEVESAVSGRLDRVLCQADEEVPVGQVIAVLDIAETTPAGSAAASAAATSVATGARRSNPPVGARSAGEGASGQAPGKPLGMFARNRAASTAESASAASLSLSLAQRTTAKRLQASKQTIPHFYLQTSFNATRIVARRQAAEPNTLVWDAFFVRAVARAIGRFERFARRFEAESLVPADSDAIGVAVDLDHDLFVIPISGGAEKTVEQISEEIRAAVARLRSGDQDARRIRPARMTVTNLGSCNVERFVPIINPPEPAILGVGRVMLVPAVLDDGQVAAQHRCTLTLCVDHRVAAGKYAAEFLGAIVEELEG